MTTSVYPIHRAIHRPMTFKGLTEQYALIGACGLVADLLLFVILYCCQVPGWLCIIIVAGLGASVITTCARFSKQYGAHGLRKVRLKRQAPTALPWRSHRLLTIPGFPILDVGDDGILSKNGDFTIGFAFTGPPLFTPSPAQYEQAHTLITKACGVLPDGCTLQWMNHYYREPWEQQSKAEEDSLLDRADREHFKGSYMAHLGYLFLTFRSSSSHKTGNRPSLIRPSITPAHTRDPAELAAYRHAAQQFRSILTDGDLLQLRYLRLDELLGTASTKGIYEQYCWMSTADEPRISSIDLADTMNILGKDLVIYSLSDAENLPAQCQPHVRYQPYSTSDTYYPVSFAACLGALLDVEHIHNLILTLEERGATMAALEKRRKRLQSLSGHSRENKAAAGSIGEFLEAAADGRRRPVRVHANIMARANDDQPTAELHRKISTAITRLGATPFLETAGAAFVYWACIPGNTGELPIHDSFVTFVEQAACLLPLETFDRGSSSDSGVFLCERYTGRPVKIDLWNEAMRKGWTSNRNMTVMGPSGGGKSYFMQRLIWQLRAMGAHLFIIDIGGSYQRLCELLGGSYLAYTPDKPICFNPFRLDEGEMPDIEKKESLLNLLLALWKRTGETFRRSEYVAVSTALQGYYQYLTDRPEIRACFNSLYDYLRDVYVEILRTDKVRREDFDMDNLLYVLRPFYEGGEYDYLLNAESQPSLLHEPMIVVELDAIKDHRILLPVVTIIFTEAFIAKMRRLSGILKVFIMDEAWKSLATEAGAELMKYLYKTIRKFYGAAVVVTQDIEDLLSNPIVKNAILNNADIRVLLDHSKFAGRFDDIQMAQGLTDHHKAQVLSINRANRVDRRGKEVFIGLTNGPSQVYRTEVSLEEHLTFTTEEKEKMVVQQYAKEHGSMQKGIVALAAAIRSGAIKFLMAFAFTGLLTMLPQGHASAQALEIAQLITAAVKRAIMAADLEVQRAQAQTIALQNVEKELENNMTGGLLDDITGSAQDQQNLFSEYYQELWQVKTALSTYSKTATLIQRQVALVKEEQLDWAAVQQDPHFSAAELSHIATVYSSILKQSARNIQQIEQVITAFITQMDDGSRLRLIDETSHAIDGNYQDLRGFTQQNTLLSLQRAKDENDILTIQSLYNIPQ